MRILLNLMIPFGKALLQVVSIVQEKKTISGERVDEKSYYSNSSIVRMKLPIGRC